MTSIKKDILDIVSSLNATSRLDILAYAGMLGIEAPDIDSGYMINLDELSRKQLVGICGLANALFVLEDASADDGY